MREENNGFISVVISGVLTAVIISIVGVLLFALVISGSSLSNSVVKAVNQFIKILAVFLGCVFSLKGRQGAIKGGLVGIFATVLTYLLFALIAGETVQISKIIVDLALLFVVGAISGAIAVNLRK